MEILFLGTSSGTPTKTRNVSALALRSTGRKPWYLVDCGEGTQHRLLSTGLSLFHLSAVFITHIHGDHCYGLPGLLASAGMLNRSADLHIVGPASVRRYLECVIETTQLKLPFPLHFIDAEAQAGIDAFPDLRVETAALSHRVPCFGYSFMEKNVEGKLDLAKLRSAAIPAGPAWHDLQQGRDITLPDGRTAAAEEFLLPRRKARKIIVGGDNDWPALLRETALGADLLIHEATYTEEGLLKAGPAPQHSSARRTASFAQEAGIPNLILIHFSPRYNGRAGSGEAIDAVAAEAREVYTGTLFLANDLEEYMLDKQGRLHKKTVYPSS